MNVGQLITLLKKFPIGIKINNNFDIIYEEKNGHVSEIFFIDSFITKKYVALVEENIQLKKELRNMKFNHKRL